MNLKSKKSVLNLIKYLPLFCLFISCNNENEDTVSKEPNNQEFLRQITNPRILAFEADVKSSNLEIEMTNWKIAIDNQDFNDVASVNNRIRIIFEDLNAEYGSENVIEYTEILQNEQNAIGTHDGSPCTRNQDGTIYTGACSFWGKVRFFLSPACGGMPTNTVPQIEEYYDCLQADICSICS